MTHSPNKLRPETTTYDSSLTTSSSILLSPSEVSNLVGRQTTTATVTTVTYSITNPIVSIGQSNFDFAFELAKIGMKNKMADIHYKYAMALEDDGKFKEAEDQFVKAEKPKEAVMMYMHSQDWESAERVAQEHDEDSLSQVLLARAKQAFLDKNYQTFESLLLRAHKPDLIVKQYQEAGLWVDALRVCREYQPARLASLQAEYEREVGSRGARDVSSILSQAHQWQQSGEYKTAVDCYLRVNNNNCRDSNTVLKALTEAANIANKYLEGEEAFAAAKALCPRLLELKQHNLAAQTYLAADLIKEAIDTFIMAEEWGKAKKVAREFEPGLEPYVDEKYAESLRRQGRADQLADVDIIAALDLLVEQGQWAKCLETARPHGSQVLHKYVALYATQLIKDGLTQKALVIYTQTGAPAFPQNYNIYRRISMDIIAMPGLEGDQAYTTWAQLRNMLYKLSEGMTSGSDGGSTTHYEFRTLLLISHYCALRTVLHSLPGMQTLVANISSALLRHVDVIPADKAFYEAGIYARDVGRDSEAFVFLNHYLDIVEAIEEGCLDSLDYTDFERTDFPQEIPLPAAPFLSPQEHEQVKEWVLAVSMDQNIEQALPLDNRGLYPSALVGPDPSSSPLPACVVTGYPVFGVPAQTITFKRPGCLANRDDWNKLAMAAKLSPTNTSLQDVLSFISEWCGALPNFSF